MAFFDNSLQLSTAQAITSTAASTLIYDVTGAGSGNAPKLAFGTASKFGADIGLGQQTWLYLAVTTAFVSGGGATLTVQIQAAPDNGSNAPGTYVTLYASQAFTAAQLVAGTEPASLLAAIPPVAPIAFAEALPRFYRFNYVVATSTFSAGAVTAGILLNPPSGLVSTLYPSNFVSGL